LNASGEAGTKRDSVCLNCGPRASPRPRGAVRSRPPPRDVDIRQRSWRIPCPEDGQLPQRCRSRAFSILSGYLKFSSCRPHRAIELAENFSFLFWTFPRWSMRQQLVRRPRASSELRSRDILRASLINIQKTWPHALFFCPQPSVASALFGYIF